MRRIAALCSILALAIPASADVFSVNWWTVDGGGAMYSTGGNFELGGTIGQPDAGVLSGGDFSLVGGFWGVNGSSESPCSGSIRGDSDCSGAVNFDDIDCFVSALIDQGSWDSCGHAGGCDYTCVNDIDQNGSVDFDDIDGFVDCLVNEGCP